MPSSLELYKKGTGIAEAFGEGLVRGEAAVRSRMKMLVEDISELGRRRGWLRIFRRPMLRTRNNARAGRSLKVAPHPPSSCLKFLPYHTLIINVGLILNLSSYALLRKRLHTSSRSHVPNVSVSYVQ